MKASTLIAISLLMGTSISASASDWVLAGVNGIKHASADKILVDIAGTPANQPNCADGLYEFVVTDPAQIRLITGMADQQALLFKGDGSCAGNNERLKHVGFNNSEPM